MARDEWEADLIEVAEQVRELKPACRAVARATGNLRSVNTVRYHAKRDETFRVRLERALGRPLRGPWLLLLALALPAPLAAIESPPFALGETGLTLTVRLRQWTEETGLWADVSPHTVTVVEEGSGEYSLGNLPPATGTNRYAAVVALSSDATRGLASYVYGATPGTRLVWREEIALPSSPIVFRRGDSYGSLSLTVTRGLTEEACTATATMDAANAQTGALLFSDRAAVISNCEQDQTTGTWGLTATADLVAADLDTVGRYLATVELCYSPGECQTLPGASSLRFEVVRRLGD